MTTTIPCNPFGGSTLVDKRFGNIYPIIKSVHEKLAEISYLVQHINDLRPADVEFRTDLVSGYIQWRYVADEGAEPMAWNNLLALTEIVGADGTDARSPEFQIAGTLLQWRYIGDPGWIDLFDLNDFIGLISATPVADTIPKAGSGGKLDTGWIDTAEVVAGLKAELADPADLTHGDAQIAVKLNATGASNRTQHNKNAETVSVFDFMSEAQIADVQARTATLDVRAAIQAAFDYIKVRGGRLVFPPGKHNISGYIGTTLWDAASTCDNVELHFQPGAELYLNPNYSIPSGTWFWHAISMEGNNVSITGQGKITSNQNLVWNADLPSQRDHYLMGVILGGKSYGHITPALGQEREGVLIEGQDVSNFHCCIVAQQASRVRILHNKTSNDTDTAILVDNCLDDVEVAYNRCINSGDDHFFARHYVNTPWALAGRYVGNYRVHHNHFENNYAKFIGFGGISDVDCHDNYGYNSWWAGINVEVDTTWYDNNRRIKIHNNTLRDCGRSWDPAHPNPTYRVPVSDSTVTCGILLTTSPAPWPLKRFEHIQIHDNVIINPQSHGVTVITAMDVEIRGNKMIPSVVTKSSVNYPTTGAAIFIQDVNRVSISGNTYGPDSGGTHWPFVYEIGGDTKTERVHIMDNPREEFSNQLFVPYSAAIKTQLSYHGFGISASQDASPSAVAAGGVLSQVLSCPGARQGDLVQISFSQHLSGLTLTAYVNADDQIAATFANNTGAPVTPGAGTYRMLCTRRGV